MAPDSSTALATRKNMARNQSEKPQVALPLLAHDESLSVYQIYCGAEYWYYEKSTAHALASHFKQLQTEGISDADIADLDVSRLTSQEARLLSFNHPDNDEEWSMLRAAETFGAGFVACSEY